MVHTLSRLCFEITIAQSNLESLIAKEVKKLRQKNEKVAAEL
jgi:hypothetical protein